MGRRFLEKIGGNTKPLQVLLAGVWCSFFELSLTIDFGKLMYMFSNPSELPNVRVEKDLPPDMVTHSPEFYLDQSNLSNFLTELDKIGNVLNQLKLKEKLSPQDELQKAALEDRFIKLTREIADFHARTDNTVH